MSNPTADWEKVGGKFYRKIQLYTAIFDQDLELENYIVSGCAHGGAIGMSILRIFDSKLSVGRFFPSDPSRDHCHSSRKQPAQADSYFTWI